MNKYAINCGEKEVIVNGSLSDNGEVIVNYNNEQYTFNSGSGEFSQGACSAEVNCNDGSYVREGAVTQDIMLPNGLKIHRDASEKIVELPDGRKFTEPNENGTNINVGDLSMNISINNSSKNQKSKIKITNDSSNARKIKINNKQFDTKKTEVWVTNKELTEALTPGFFTTFIFILGLISFDISGIGLGIGIYLFYALPTTVRYIVQRKIHSKDKLDPVDESDQNTDDNSIENIKEEYANGELTDREFENKIENVLDGRDNLEIEKEYN